MVVVIVVIPVYKRVLTGCYTTGSWGKEVVLYHRVRGIEVVLYHREPGREVTNHFISLFVI